MSVPYTILYIEDNVSNIVVVQRVIDSMGYQLLVAKTGQTGLELTANEKPDMILLDISLPDIDGLDIARQLRATPEQAHLPIIAVTASAMVGDRERCLDAGCNDYISKPFQVQTLVEVIKRRMIQSDIGEESA
jgi:CheY-like chemotaxis protein